MAKKSVPYSPEFREQMVEFVRAGRSPEELSKEFERRHAAETALAGQSVYVDLLAGHNAYINSGSQNSGSYTLEDSIVNVPNMIGSSGSDIIISDNGTDRLQGDTGADQLYAGTGFDTFVYASQNDSNLVMG